MHAKLHIPYDGVTPWDYTKLLDDIVSLMTGETNVANLKLLTGNLSTPGGDGLITSTIPAGWTLLETAVPTDVRFPSAKGITTGKVALLQSTLADGRPWYMGVGVNTSGFLFLSIGPARDPASCNTYQPLSATASSYVSTWRIANTYALDIGFNIGPHHFASIPLSDVGVASYERVALVRERTKLHPGDDANVLPVFGMAGDSNLYFGNCVRGGFNAGGSWTSAPLSPQIGTYPESTYASSADYSAIEADGVSRVQLVQPAVFGGGALYGEVLSSIPIWTVGRNGHPTVNIGERLVLDGRTFEMWYLGSNNGWANGVAAQPLWVEVV